ncbi:small conductance mechanosensitive channel [Muriicola jejuensis]|uniref:Mechanosensitive ion channel n=1 Tax=Muriicola jejuensis TaxID=504488 RepID=A0A6P0UFM3_9FLAO|nr:mechanosensitive ion channel family protein [Muriicola jejuensis]NER11250.1 mechanosensitive ion channel [Muriicola jejuensis]SMP21840.1 small conductance mechanosensitive channel [Muriicola jejuensis]
MKEELSSSFDVLLNKLNTWGNTLIENLPNMLLAIAVLLTSYFLARYVSKGVTRLVSKKVPQKSISNLISNLTTVVVVLFGLFLALSILDLNDALMSLLTGAGVAGLVVGLALQGALSNTISGVVLSFRKNIRIGDWVETNGFAGEVIKINLNNFIIKEADNNKVIIPNKTILENPLKNFTLTNKMRVVLGCGVGYESDLDKVETLTKQTVKDCIDQVRSVEDVEFYFEEFGDSSINFIVRFYITSESAIEKLRAKNTVIKALKKAFDKEGVNIPFPIRTLEFNSGLKLQNGVKAAFAAN